MITRGVPYSTAAPSSTTLPIALVLFLAGRLLLGRGLQVLHVEERGSVEPHVDERRLHAVGDRGHEAHDPALIDGEPVDEDTEALDETLRGTALVGGLAVQGKNDYDVWVQRVHLASGERVWGDAGIYVTHASARASIWWPKPMRAMARSCCCSRWLRW